MAMHLIIDANILKGYYVETVLNLSNCLTESTILIFDRLGKDDVAYLDDGGIIEHQWKNLVDKEWFEAWFPTLFIEGKAVEIKTNPCGSLRSSLAPLGFPVNDRDFHYVRTAMAVVEIHGLSIILSEDIHFYEPRAKGSASVHRLNVITKSIGKVASRLTKFGILVKCVSTYCQDIRQGRC